MNSIAEQEMLESQLERAAKENASLTQRLHLALVRPTKEHALNSLARQSALKKKYR